MGTTDWKTAGSPISSRRSAGTSFCRNVSYERFCTSMRFGISTIDGILPKSLRLRRPHWIVPAISSPESSRAALASFVFPALERRRCRRHPALWWRPRRGPPRAPADYFTCTVAPCSSSFFFISSASALVTFSFTGFGAPSTRSFASLSPSPVSSRTTLMTWIFFSPAAPRMTSNSVFSSVAAAPPAVAPPAPQLLRGGETGDRLELRRRRHLALDVPRLDRERLVRLRERLERLGDGDRVLFREHHPRGAREVRPQLLEPGRLDRQPRQTVLDDLVLRRYRAELLAELRELLDG